MNSCTIHGRLTRDPETRSYTNAKGEAGSVCDFTVAVNRRSGDEADFFRCTIFGKRAEVIQKWFAKGAEIVCRGHMQCDPYEDKDGKKRYPWKLIVEDFDFCGSKKDSGSQGAPQDSFEQADDDVPF